jgi:hypothetical protein
MLAMQPLRTTSLLAANRSENAIRAFWAVAAGQTVRPGDILLYIEAMTRETVLHAARDDTVVKVLVCARDKIVAEEPCHVRLTCIVRYAGSARAKYQASGLILIRGQLGF